MSAAEWIVITGIGFYLLTCWAIFDIARKDFGGIEKKAAWAFVALIPFLGPILYIAMGLRKGSRKAGA
jgi:bacteriorhodopsin